MEGPMLIGWVLIGVMTLMSITLLMGRGSFLIAGYNTSSREEKEKFHVKRLCRVMGMGLGLITLMVAAQMLKEYGIFIPILSSAMPWGLFIVLIFMLVLSNTWCRKR